MIPVIIPVPEIECIESSSSDASSSESESEDDGYVSEEEEMNTEGSVVLRTDQDQFLYNHRHIIQQQNETCVRLRAHISSMYSLFHFKANATGGENNPTLNDIAKRNVNENGSDFVILVVDKGSEQLQSTQTLKGNRMQTMSHFFLTFSQQNFTY